MNTVYSPLIFDSSGRSTNHFAKERPVSRCKWNPVQPLNQNVCLSAFYSYRHVSQVWIRSQLQRQQKQHSIKLTKLLTMPIETSRAPTQWGNGDKCLRFELGGKCCRKWGRVNIMGDTIGEFICSQGWERVNIMVGQNEGTAWWLHWGDPLKYLEYFSPQSAKIPTTNGSQNYHSWWKNDTSKRQFIYELQLFTGYLHPCLFMQRWMHVLF